jgi:hypothetical protein
MSGYDRHITQLVTYGGNILDSYSRCTQFEYHAGYRLMTFSFLCLLYLRFWQWWLRVQCGVDGGKPRRFWGKYRLHLQGRTLSQALHAIYFLLVSCLAYFSILKTEAMFLRNVQITRSYNPHYAISVSVSRRMHEYYTESCPDRLFQVVDLKVRRQSTN